MNTPRPRASDNGPGSTHVIADVCVVGGGPAGLMLALLLARSGRRVAVVERSRSLRRAFRGEILQPGGQALLDRLGVLDPARERGCRPHSRFRLVEHGRVLLDIDYRRLPAPYNCLLGLPQEHLLGALLDAGGRYEELRYLPGNRVDGLLLDGDRVRGVTAAGAGGRVTVEAACTVAADGRFSKTRALAGLDHRRIEAFDHDVLWFRLPAPPRPVDAVQVFRAGGNPVLVHRTVPDGLQLGWTLPHRGYRDLAARGFEAVREEICRAVPPYADLVAGNIRSLGDLTLLDVFSGVAPQWARDGLVMIGDAAHTHSPIGAQGINLALQDATLLHPLLVDALDRGDTGAAVLGGFQRAREGAIARAMRLQVMQSRAMLSRNPAAARVRPVLARLLARTPIYQRVLHRLAYGEVAA